MHPTTIFLCKSKSNQAALVPQEQKVFLEKAYNAGDHQAWTQVLAHSIMALHPKKSWG